MGNTTAWVKQALQELGSDASDQAVKNYIYEKDSSVPEGHVSLALRKLRRKIISRTRKQASANHHLPSDAQGELFLGNG